MASTYHSRPASPFSQSCDVAHAAYFGPFCRDLSTNVGDTALIHVIATIELNPGTRDAFLAEFRKIVAPVRAEAGCIDYGPTIDTNSGIAAQCPMRLEVVTVVERWESLEHLQAHLVAPHMVEYRPKVKDFVKTVKLQILEPV